MGLQKNTAIFGGGRQEVFLISLKLFCNFIEIALRHGCSPVNLLHIFRTLFPINTSGWLLLDLVYIVPLPWIQFVYLCIFLINHYYTKLTFSFQVSFSTEHFWNHTQLWVLESDHDGFSLNKLKDQIKVFFNLQNVVSFKKVTPQKLLSNLESLNIMLNIIFTLPRCFFQRLL